MAPSPARRARPARRRDPEDKRERILAAAARFLGEEGYEAMTAARVAAAAGVSEGLIFHHFGSKRGVLEALAESFGRGAFETVFASSAQAGVAPQTSEDLLRPLFAYAREHRDLVRAFARLGDGADRELAVGAVRDRVVASLTDQLVRQEDLGRVRPMDPAMVASLLFSLVMAALTECFVHGDGSREEDWLREVAQCVDLAIRADPREALPTARRNG
ncbi:MAG TPA: TetR/AcrR family transcriptional regulator [Myxococcota bacterium]|nr:TetR/AcrR family transcriptional regulator [Myxococcota bacterium]